MGMTRKRFGLATARRFGNLRYGRLGSLRYDEGNRRTGSRCKIRLVPPLKMKSGLWRFLTATQGSSQTRNRWALGRNPYRGCYEIQNVKMRITGVF